VRKYGGWISEEDIYIDMMLMLRSQFFIGNPASTVSMNVARVRWAAHGHSASNLDPSRLGCDAPPSQGSPSQGSPSEGMVKAALLPTHRARQGHGWAEGTVRPTAQRAPRFAIGRAQ